MTRAAIYARVSSEQQAQKQTIESQVAALRQRVKEDNHLLLPQDVFVDDGVSGTTVVRPALENLRDRVAERLLDVLYVQGPDRLARKYAYQVLLLEEFRAGGVKVIFLHGSHGQTAEDELLVQVQGMIAEYERAKIVERGRRGRQFRARQGSINALVCAPFGYAYRAKTAMSPASVQIVLHEARVVRSIFDGLLREQKSISDIVRALNAGNVPPRRGGHWTKSTVALMLKNTAYMGKAAFGKTRVIERVPERLRPLRGTSALRSKKQARQPVADWIFIDVPPIVSADLFQAVAEQLARNSQLSMRKARRGRYLLQGLTVCEHCGYASFGTTTTSSGGKWPRSYYRCGGRDPARTPHGRVCNVLPVRADLLDEHVWLSVCQILQNPERLQEEWSQRTEDSGALSGLQSQHDHLARTLAMQERSLKRLIDAYEIGAINLDDLKQRTPAIQERTERTRRELHTVQQQLHSSRHLRAIVARLEEFSARVSKRLTKLKWEDKQRLIRTLIAKIEVGEQGATIVYRLPSSSAPPASGSGSGGSAQGGPKRGEKEVCGLRPRELAEGEFDIFAEAGEPQMHVCCGAQGGEQPASFFRVGCRALFREARELVMRQ